MLFGNETAGRLASFADHCVESAEQMIAEYGIDCDYRQSGNIMSVVHPSQEARLRKATASTGASIRILCSRGSVVKSADRGFP
jgi:hypothetical protein